MILMKFLKNRRAFVTHPAMLFIVAMVLGLVVAWFWIHYVPGIPNPFCK